MTPTDTVNKTTLETVESPWFTDINVLEFVTVNESTAFNELELNKTRIMVCKYI